jgi:hypothetical protein
MQLGLGVVCTYSTIPEVSEFQRFLVFECVLKFALSMCLHLEFVIVSAGSSPLKHSFVSSGSNKTKNRSKSTMPDH